MNTFRTWLVFIVFWGFWEYERCRNMQLTQKHADVCYNSHVKYAMSLTRLPRVQLASCSTPVGQSARAQSRTARALHCCVCLHDNHHRLSSRVKHTLSRTRLLHAGELLQHRPIQVYNRVNNNKSIFLLVLVVVKAATS